MSVEASLGEEARRELRSLEQGLAEADPPTAAALHFRSAQLWLGVGAAGLDPAAAHLRSALDRNPSDEEAFRLLAAALRRAGKHADLARACEDSCREAPAVTRAYRLAVAAELYDELGRTEEAAQCRERVMAIPGEPLRAARLLAEQALAQMHRKKGEWRELAAVLDKLAEDLDGTARLAALAEQAQVLGERIGAHSEAWEAWLKVLARRADDDRALAFARKHLDETHQPLELARVLAAAAATTQNRERGTQLWRETAQVAEERARDLELAKRALRRAWQLSPLDADARTALKRLLALAGDWRAYRDLLEREARQVASADEKIDVYRELAAFQRQVLRDDRAAAEVYGLVLQLAPRDAEALAARVEIFEAAGDEVQLTQALRRQLRQAKPEARSALCAKLAEALRRQGQVTAAAEILESALRETPSADLLKTVERVREAAERGGELRAVARLLLATGDKKGAAFALEQAGERESARRLWRELGADEAVARLDARPDPSEQDVSALLAKAQVAGERGAAGLHYRVAQIYAHREPPERDKARAQLELALELWPSDEQSFALLERLLEADALWDPLVELYRGAVADAREEVRRVELLGRLARVLCDRRGDAAGATAAYEQLLAIDPANADTQAALEQLYRQTGKLAGVVRLHENELARTAGDDRVAVLAKLARLQGGEMKDEPLAIARWKEVLQIDPGHAEALAFCRARAERAERWRDVVLLLTRAAEVAQTQILRAACWREMAALCEHKLEDREGAAKAWRRVREIRPDDAEARASVRRLLAELGRFADLAATLRADLARAVSPETKLPLLEALAEIERDRLEDIEAAAETLWAIVQIIPDHKDAHDELAVLLDKLGRHRERAALLRRRLALAEVPAERVLVLRKLALLLCGPLGAVGEAITAYREILGIAPGDDGALAALREIHGSRNEWKELAAVLQSALGAKHDSARESALRLELSRLYDEKLGQREEAAKELERGLAADRANPEILGALAKLYEAMGSWEKLIETLRRRAGGESGGLAQSLCDIGRIYDDKMNDLGHAREAYEQAVHLDSTRRVALSALRSIAERRADWREAVALARREEKLVTDPRERAALLFSVGNLLVDKLDRPARAAETFEEALRADPSHLGAAERLADLYFAQNDYTRTAPLLEKLVECGAARDRAHDLYYRLGVAAEKGGEADKAFAYYIKSFNHDSIYEPTLTRLAELCFERGQWENTVRVCEAIARLAADRVGTEKQKPSKAQGSRPGVIRTADELAELHHRHAMAELHLGQRQAALRLLPGIARGGGQRSVLPEGAWRDVADSWASLRLEPRLLAQIDPAARRRAESAISRCLALKPKHGGALQALAALAVARQKWDDALLQLDRCVDAHEVDKLRRCDLLLLAGDICEKKTLDRPRAERYYRRALQLFPQDGVIRKRLEAVKRPR